MASLMDLITGVRQQQPAPQQKKGMAALVPDAGLTNDQKVLMALKKNFDNPAVIAGIMANIDHETGGTFDYAQKQKKGPARGLIQMEGVMLDGYKNYLSDNKLPDSVDSQVGFLKDVMTTGKSFDIGAGHRAKLQKAMMSNDPIAFAQEFTNRVERPGVPHMDRRIAKAKYWGSKLKENGS